MQPSSPKQLLQDLTSGKDLILIGETLRYELRKEGEEFSVFAGTERYPFRSYLEALAALVTLAGDLHEEKPVVQVKVVLPDANIEHFHALDARLYNLYPNYFQITNLPGWVLSLTPRNGKEWSRSDATIFDQVMSDGLITNWEVVFNNWEVIPSYTSDEQRRPLINDVST
jgi:hypothetical protein